MNMISLVKTAKGEGNMALMERPVPEINADEALIRVAYAGICGTDVHIMHDQFAYWPPVIMGHEFSGEIVKTGAGVTRFKAGDKVVGEPHNKACMQCELCRNGKIQLCRDKRSIGWGIDGAFAEYLKMPESLLHKIPENVSMKAAAMAEPSAIVAHQLLERTTVTPGDIVVVMGVGAIALLAAQMAKAAGASKVILCGCTSDVAYRLKVATELSCYDRFVNVQTDELDPVIAEETDGNGADIVVEASGAGAAIRNGIRALRKTGKFCAIGMTSKGTVEIPWNMAMMKALDLKFNMSSSYNGWKIALDLMKRGKLSLEPLEKTARLTDWEKAFHALENGEAMKVIFSNVPGDRIDI